MSELFFNWLFSYGVPLIFAGLLYKVFGELAYLYKEVATFKGYVVFLVTKEIEKEKSGAEFEAKLEELKEEKRISRWAYDEIKKLYFSTRSQIMAPEEKA